MEITAIRLEHPDDVNLVVGQAHFIKTVEDLHEVLAQSSAQLRFGVAFCEASGPRLVRRSGNDPELVELATRGARAVGAGHSFVVARRSASRPRPTSPSDSSSCAASATSSELGPPRAAQ
jgi:hypothetical protein